jgi:predicted NUDIX family NTP pyrophosphohydrolase
MMAKEKRVAPISAGIILWRRHAGLEVLLVHPGGPFWRNRDVGAWMIPKGQVEDGEDAAQAALREFAEETGAAAIGVPKPLCRIRQSGGKWVEAFALEGDFDVESLASNDFLLEYPPKSGVMRSFPEVDAAAWMSIAEARRKILPSQIPILDALEAQLTGG